MVQVPHRSIWFSSAPRSFVRAAVLACVALLSGLASFAPAFASSYEPTTELLRAVKGMAVLHLADAGWEFLAVRSDPRTWAAFLGLLSFATWMAEHTDMASVTTGSRSGREAAA